MPPNVHTVLLNDASAAILFMLPIKQMIKVVHEAHNKNIKKYREYHSRKASRVNINTDIFQRL
jgi:hypothetical protein